MSDVPASLSDAARHDLGAAGSSAVAPQTAAGGPTRGAADRTTKDGSGSFDSTSGSNEAARAISEADVIQVQGERLYALSRVAGLAIIDVQDPAHLKLLGRYRELPAEPFELYLRDDVALVMFTGWGEYKRLDDGNFSYVSTSKLLALDVSDAANVAKLGSFDVPGSISDSRMVGDVLYVVSYENGYCWGCDTNKPRTTISSLNVHDPKNVQPIDELAYGDTQGTYGGGVKSITVTPKRIYVSGPEYGSNGPTSSTVQVVDISDPNGDLVEGASVKVAGQIMSRWQMDEYDNVLRVISQQQPNWTGTGPTLTEPAVETFRVESSMKLSALGKTNVQLPKAETLQSARFDGTRAYLITAQQTDPLFTIDLSDPAHPKQLAALEMPGFVWHMEPRGERLLGVGYDRTNSAGPLAVSLFDVKDLSHPALLSRVNFGGSWANLPEDQDRAHKVFRVLDDAGLILVPFSGWNYGNVEEGKYCGGNYVGGVQIIDFKNDTLKARGAAPSTGQARRALLQHDRLLSVSDERVEAFDISNRDQPQLASQVVLARQVSQALQLDNSVVARVSYDSRDYQPLLDFVGASDAGEANESLGQLSLKDLAGGAPADACYKSINLQQVLTRGSELDLVYESYASDTDGKGKQIRGVVVVDASTPSKPTIKSDTYWSNDEYWNLYANYYSYGYYNSSPQIVRTANTIALLESMTTYSPMGEISRTDVRMRVIDMRDSGHVTYKVLPVQTSATSFSGLVAAGDTILTSHLEGSEKGRARFYIDRFDVSDPGTPRQMSSVNVPGGLLSYDNWSGRAITSDQKRTLLTDTTYEDCSQRFAYFEWNTYNSNGTATVGASSGSPRVTGSGGGGASDVVAPEPEHGDCMGFTQSLNLVHLLDNVAVLEDTLKLEDTQQLTNLSAGDGVLFGSVGHGGYYFGRGLVGPAIIDCFGPCGGASISQPPSELLVLGSFASGKFEVGHISVEQGDANSWYGFWGSPPVYAYGKRAILVGQSDVAIIDASTPSAPAISKRVTLFSSAQSVDVKNNIALLALGAQGVQWLSLE